MNYVSELIEISKTDASASEILFNNQLFPQSYFFFQQAVEKSNKAFGIMTGAIQEKDAFSIRHDQIKIYKEGLKNELNNLLEHQELISQHPKASDHEFYQALDINSYLERLKKDGQIYDSIKNFDLVTISGETIDTFIKELNDLKSVDVKKIDRPTEEQLASQITKMADWFNSFGTEAGEEGKRTLLSMLTDSAEKVKFFDYVQKTLSTLIQTIFINRVLYFFALLTVQHSSRTRYIQDGKAPREIYTASLPLVNRLPEFLKILKDATDMLEALHKEIETQNQLTSSDLPNPSS